MKIGNRVYAKTGIGGGWSDDYIESGTWGTIIEIDKLDHLGLNITVKFDGGKVSYVDEHELGY